MNGEGGEVPQYTGPERRGFTRREGDVNTDAVTRARISAVLAEVKEGTLSVDDGTERLMAVERGKMIYDELTGAASRTEILRILNREIRESAVNPKHLVAVVFSDTDDYKNVNDTEPDHHEAGDRALKELVRIGSETVGQYGDIGRMSGDELLLVLHGDDATKLKDVAQQFGETVGNTLAGRAALARPKVTVSLGMVFLNPGETEVSLVHRADLAMYESKKNGRNQLTVDMGADKSEVVKFGQV